MSLRKELILNERHMQRAALHITSGNAEDARDLVQDGSERMLRYEDRFLPGSDFRSWSFIIMRNIFFNKCRKAKKENSLFISRVMEDQDEFASQELRKISSSKKEQGNFIEICVDRLPEKIRITFILFTEGLPQKEVGALLGICVGTVKTRVFTARKRIRGMIERSGGCK